MKTPVPTWCGHSRSTLQEFLVLCQGSVVSREVVLAGMLPDGTAQCRSDLPSAFRGVDIVVRADDVQGAERSALGPGRAQGRQLRAEGPRHRRPGQDQQLRADGARRARLLGRTAQLADGRKGRDEDRTLREAQHAIEGPLLGPGLLHEAQRLLPTFEHGGREGPLTRWQQPPGEAVPLRMWCVHAYQVRHTLQAFEALRKPSTPRGLAREAE
mmetsp:Transcript_104773/g.291786  ORF Transcript_104773/g.291786 Transcript_104773/m.291786 type:complete len:213 (+) Transcript_104773:123-761(+)